MTRSQQIYLRLLNDKKMAELWGGKPALKSIYTQLLSRIVHLSFPGNPYYQTKKAADVVQFFIKAQTQEVVGTWPHAISFTSRKSILPWNRRSVRFGIAVSQLDGTEVSEAKKNVESAYVNLIGGRWRYHGEQNEYDISDALKSPETSIGYEVFEFMRELIEEGFNVKAFAKEYPNHRAKAYDDKSLSEPDVFRLHYEIDGYWVTLMVNEQ